MHQVKRLRFHNDFAGTFKRNTLLAAIKSVSFSSLTLHCLYLEQNKYIFPFHMLKGEKRKIKDRKYKKWLKKNTNLFDSNCKLYNVTIYKIIF